MEMLYFHGTVVFMKELRFLFLHKDSLLIYIFLKKSVLVTGLCLVGVICSVRSSMSIIDNDI